MPDGTGNDAAVYEFALYHLTDLPLHFDVKIEVIE